MATSPRLRRVQLKFITLHLTRGNPRDGKFLLRKGQRSGSWWPPRNNQVGRETSYVPAIKLPSHK